MHEKLHSETGFTLIELIITVVVAAVLASIAIPSFNNFVREERITSLANEILTSLVYARTEAIKRNRRVTMCKSADPAAAQPTCDTAANTTWNEGWIIFVDGEPPAAGNGQREPATETLLRTAGPINGGGGGGAMQLTSADADIAYNVSYLPRGITQKIGGGSQSGTIKLCEGGDPIKGRNIIISQTGRVRVATPSPAFTSCP